MALVVHQDHLFFTRTETHPIGTLIEGIWDHYPSQARAITRNRIYSFQKATPLCDGMLKVAAKRVSYIGKNEYEALLTEWRLSKNTIEIIPQTPTLRPLPFSPENCTVQQVAELSKLKIGAILLDSDQRVVSWGWNDHFPNKILHAEVMLVKNYIAITGKQKIPNNYTLISTLQPCAMCAGYLYEYCEDFRTLKVIYEKEDPGPFAQNSILVPGSQLFEKLFG